MATAKEQIDKQRKIVDMIYNEKDSAKRNDLIESLASDFVNRAYGKLPDNDKVKSCKAADIKEIQQYIEKCIDNVSVYEQRTANAGKTFSDLLTKTLKLENKSTSDADKLKLDKELMSYLPKGSLSHDEKQRLADGLGLTSDYARILLEPANWINNDYNNVFEKAMERNYHEIRDNISLGYTDGDKDLEKRLKEAGKSLADLLAPFSVAAVDKMNSVRYDSIQELNKSIRKSDLSSEQKKFLINEVDPRPQITKDDKEALKNANVNFNSKEMTKAIKELVDAYTTAKDNLYDNADAQARSSLERMGYTEENVKGDEKREQEYNTLLKEERDRLINERLPAIEEKFLGQSASWRNSDIFKDLPEQNKNLIANAMTYMGQDYSTVRGAVKDMYKDMLVNTELYDDNGKRAPWRLVDAIEDNASLLCANCGEFSLWLREKCENTVLAAKKAALKIKNAPKVALHKTFMALDGIAHGISRVASKIREGAVKGILGKVQDLTPSFVPKNHTKAFITKKYVKNTMLDLDRYIGAGRTKDTTDSLAYLRGVLSNPNTDAKTKDDIIRYANMCLDKVGHYEEIKLDDVVKAVGGIKPRPLTKSEQKMVDYAKRKQQLNDKFEKNVMSGYKSAEADLDKLYKATATMQGERRSIFYRQKELDMEEAAAERSDRYGTSVKEEYKRINDRKVSKKTRLHALQEKASAKLDALKAPTTSR